MKKIRWKSMLAFVLAFMLVISVVPVTQVNASETGESISVSENSVSGNTIGEPAEEGGADQENHGENADNTDYDLNQDSQEQLNDGSDTENTDDNESNQSQEELLLKDEQQEDEDIITEQKNSRMTFTLPRMVSYPEITSFELVENGEEIELGYDKEIHIIFKGTTMEGAEFSEDNTTLLLKEPGGYQKYLTAASVKGTGNEGEYELIFQIMSSNESRWEAGEYKFDYLTIGDSQGNMKSFDFSTADENSIPVFTVCLPVNTTIKLENIEFENNQFVISDEVLNPKSLVKVEVEGDSEENLDDTVILKYVCETPEESRMDSYEIGCSSFESENGKEFQTSISVDPRFSAGTYVLKEAYYETQSNGKEKISVDNIQSSFTIEKNYSDHDAPKILDLKIYYNGSEIEPGQSFVKEDTLEVHVKMEEVSEIYSYINLASSGFNAQYVSINSNEGKTIKHEDGTVTYIYDISLSGPDEYQPMYAGEWFVRSIYAQDIYQNVTEATGYEVMYFYLKDNIDDAVTDPVFYCNVYVYKNGVQEVTLKPPSKRVTSVEEIFTKAQQEIKNYTEIEGFEGWYIDHLDKIVGSAEEFSFTGNRSDLNVTQVKIIPIYETKEITVEIQYTSESGTMTMEKKLTVGKEATYQEICDLLDKAEDIPHSSKLKLKGWTVGDDHDGILEETIPLGVYSVSVTAQYNEKSDDTGDEGNEGGSGDNLGDSDDTGSGGDSGNAGGSGDTGNEDGSGNAGGSGDTGNEDSSGNAGGSGDTGNEDGSGNAGGSGDTGNEDSSGNTGDSDDIGSGEDGSNNTGSSGDSGNISDSADSGSTGVISTVIKPEEATEETEQEILLEIPRLIQETQVSEFPTLSTEDNEETTAAVKLEESVIAQKVEEARKAEEGTSLVIEMTTEEGETATEIPVAVLEIVKGKDVEIVLDMGDYSWTINGKDIQTEELEAINLQVVIDSNAIDTSVVEEFANGEPTRQITLVHNGEFGFKATLTINVGSQYEGETGNLYYYNSDGELEFIDAGQIDADGNVNLDFSHASDYVVVVGRDRTEEETQKIEESMPAEILSEEVVPVEEEIEGTEKVLTLLVIIFAIVMAAGVVLVKKSRK